MLLAQTPLTAQDVLRMFHHDEPALFSGAAFNTVAIICLGFCLVRRRFNAMLVWLGIFAHFYGDRLWLDTDILSIALAHAALFHRIHRAITFVVPVPAFFFFQAAGLMPRRGKLVAGILAAVFTGMAVLALFGISIPLLHTINNVIVIAALVWVVFLAYRRGARDHDFVVLRRGLLCFAVLALWDNLGGARWLDTDLEPYGFAVLLATLGYVAARRTLQREEQLIEIQRELSLARNIQLSLLPGEFPADSSFQVAALYVPMRSVAGDFYDFVVAEEHCAGLLIADVSGHGVPAALIASMVKMAALSQRGQAAHPGLVLAGMNRALFGNTQGQYVTAAYVHLDAERGALCYAAAGHPPILLLRAGQVSEIAENGLLLAAVDNVAYSELELPVEAGDRLVLYTDGMVEARNGAGQMFGETALIDAVKSTAAMAAKDAAKEIVQSVRAWAPRQDDDLTILVCDVAGLNVSPA